jgi:hypothetical protein
MLVVIVLSCFGLAGWRSTAPAYKVGKAVQVEYQDEPISGMQLIPGTFRIPDSQVLVSGHQPQAGAMLLGALGVLIDSAAGKRTGEALVGGSAGDMLRVQLNDRARAITDELIAAMPPGKVNTFAAQADARLQVSVNVVLSFSHNETYARPYIWLKAGLVPPGVNHATWGTSYFASNGPARPMRGDGSWTADGGAEFRRTLDESLREAITLMLADVATPFPRDPATIQAIWMDYPHSPDAIDFKVYRLGEDDKYVYFMPKLSGAWLTAGVHAVDKYMLEYYTKTGRFAPKDAATGSGVP